MADPLQKAPLFSRPAAVSPYGKCDSLIEFRCPSDLVDQLQAFASLEDKPLSTYCREVLEHHALLEQRRLKRIVDKFGGSLDGTNVR